jgi:hypothetical protein
MTPFCMACPAGCSSCFFSNQFDIFSKLNCLFCISGYTLDSKNKICISLDIMTKNNLVCKSNQYKFKGSSNIWTCLNCPIGCLNCDVNNKAFVNCMGCNSTYF